MLLQRVLVGYKDLHKIVWPNPHDEADRAVRYKNRPYYVKKLDARYWSNVDLPPTYHQI